MTFDQLNLAEPLLRSLQTEGYSQPTPIQEKAIPPIMQAQDLLGCAQTGTGKTAAFALPVLHLLYNKKQAGNFKPNTIKVLVLTPTRELAVQVEESFRVYGKHAGIKSTVIFGGVSQHGQEQALRRGADVLVATPGRLMDLINQRIIKLDTIEVFILDEADRMLDMGFIADIKRIVPMLPKQRQTLFFSATMPKEIRSLADSLLTNPAFVEVAPVSSTADTVKQEIFFVEKPDKRALLAHVLKDKTVDKVLVFTRTKHGADKVVKDLDRQGVRSEAIHGNKAQNARQRALNNFKDGNIRVLVATDIAARGIDVDNISHVINYEIPNEPETYVHRIGRTGRAGASGIALSFCDLEEREYVRDIQKLIRKPIPLAEVNPYSSDQPVSEALLLGIHEKSAPKKKVSPKSSPSSGRSSGSGAGSGGGRTGFWRNKSFQEKQR